MFYRNMLVHVLNKFDIIIQSNLRREDTLGQRPLSSSWRLSNICPHNLLFYETSYYSVCMNQGEMCGDVDNNNNNCGRNE